MNLEALPPSVIHHYFPLFNQCYWVVMIVVRVVHLSVKQVNFYDDDVQFWQIARNRSAASEGPSSVSHHTSNFSSPASSTRGRHFLVICCENKAIFLDLVTMRGRDVPKQELDNRSLLWWVPVCLCFNFWINDLFVFSPTMCLYIKKRTNLTTMYLYDELYS